MGVEIQQMWDEIEPNIGKSREPKKKINIFGVSPSFRCFTIWPHLGWISPCVKSHHINSCEVEIETRWDLMSHKSEILYSLIIFIVFHCFTVFHGFTVSTMWTAHNVTDRKWKVQPARCSTERWEERGHPGRTGSYNSAHVKKSKQKKLL